MRIEVLAVVLAVWFFYVIAWLKRADEKAQQKRYDEHIAQLLDDWKRKYKDQH